MSTETIYDPERSDGVKSMELLSLPPRAMSDLKIDSSREYNSLLNSFLLNKFSSIFLINSTVHTNYP